MLQYQNKTIFPGYAHGMQTMPRPHIVGDQSAIGPLKIRNKRQGEARFGVCLSAAAFLVSGMLVALAFAQPSEISVANIALPQDLSPWGMFLHADTIVKAVMIGLAFASLV